ncbi:zinc-binding dehydrogenase [Streptomyces sp. SLBN-31]|uniref:zinc-binding dehydrogenase n=1 Tax=Streptomyces sp. SLBN-31 TaxID=2768444 RepID=UPI0021B2D4F0|nr:zinc-binding dehydrogenase [Streptomyces sp. SLBN-31]
MIHQLYGSRETERTPGALDEGMAMPAEGRLRMKSRRTMPMREAAEAHRLLESGGVRERIILSVG